MSAIPELVNLEAGDYVKTVFNPKYAFPVLDVRKVGAGYQVNVQTEIAGQQSQQLLRGNEITTIIKRGTQNVIECQNARGPMFQRLRELSEDRDDGVTELVGSVEAVLAERASTKKEPDYISQLIERLSMEVVAARAGLNVAELNARWAHLDGAKRRMCYGNTLRALYKKESARFHTEFDH